MPRETFLLRIEDWAEVHELPGSWPPERLREILRRVEFDDPVADADVLEMVQMALQDLQPRPAAELVLEVVFGDRMSSGVRQNLVDDLEDDRPWEQFARVDKQAGIFEAMVLLQKAFPRRYGIPDAVRVHLHLQATDAATGAWLRAGPPAALLVRLLAGGMPQDAMLNRLYAEELKSEHFPDATHILWRISAVDGSGPEEAATHTCDVYSSWQWLAPLEHVSAWEAAGHPDGDSVPADD